MEFFFRYKNWIIATMIILLGSYIVMSFYQQASMDWQETKDFFKPIQQNK